MKNKPIIITTTADVDIDLDEIVERIPTFVLEQELASRKDRSDKNRDTIFELIEAIREGNHTHLRIVLDRWMPGAGAMI
jgi:KaiC/GvpD/RAD55 family RecA-like ATPase